MMFTTRQYFGLLSMIFLTGAAMANTVWVKDRAGNLCKNSLSTNPDQLIGYGGHDGGGNFIMTISNPSDGVVTPASGACLNIPQTGTSASPTPIIFNGPASLFKMRDVNMLKPGTNGALECLRQGQNLTAVATNAVPLVSGPYSMTLHISFTDGCVPGTDPVQLLTPTGQPNIVRNLRITGGPKLFLGDYYVFNPAAIPEPGSLALLLSGAASLAGLGALARRNRNRSIEDIAG